MSKIKYYAYVSQTKVDMLFSQIPPTIRDRLETEVKLKSPLAEISFSKKQFPDTLYTRLYSIVDYLEKQEEVGSIGHPLAYFKGTIRMGWAQIHPGIIFFGGKLNDTVIGLGGSMNNLLGYQWSVKDIPFGVSHTPWLVALLSKEIEMMTPFNFVEGKDYQTYPGITYESIMEEKSISATYIWANDITTLSSKYTINKFEFIAKTLRYSSFDGKNVLLGTPIYVSHVE